MSFGYRRVCYWCITGTSWNTKPHRFLLTAICNMPEGDNTWGLCCFVVFIFLCFCCTTIVCVQGRDKKVVHNWTPPTHHKRTHTHTHINTPQSLESVRKARNKLHKHSQGQGPLETLLMWEKSSSTEDSTTAPGTTSTGNKKCCLLRQLLTLHVFN